MSIASNLPVVFTNPESVLLPTPFGRDVNISDNTYDELIGLLETKTESRAAAENLAASIIQGLVQQDISINEIIDRLRSSSNSEIDALLVLFLNNTRVGTSYLGLASEYQVNPYVARTILP